MEYNYLNIKFPNHNNLTQGNLSIENESHNENHNTIIYKSISELGCQVSTGNIVWNQRKEKLVSDSINPVNNKLNHIIIYSHNLKDNTIQLINESNETLKKQYYKNESSEISNNEISNNEIENSGNESGIEAVEDAVEVTESVDDFVGFSTPIILVNRVMGSHNKKIKAVLITKDTLKLPHFKNRSLAAENHINVIKVLGNKVYKEKEKILKKIYQSLINLPSIYLNSISGNSQISSNELANLIPIKI